MNRVFDPYLACSAEIDVQEVAALVAMAAHCFTHSHVYFSLHQDNLKQMMRESESG
jgi:hypothetical protein